MGPMESADHYKLPLVSLSIELRRTQTSLELRAEELEDLAVRLANLVPPAAVDAGALDEGELELLALARDGAAMRQRHRERRAERSNDVLPPLQAVPDQRSSQ